MWKHPRAKIMKLLSQSTSSDIEKKKVNEINGFLQQILTLISNDIKKFDRWYYGKIWSIF